MEAYCAKMQVASSTYRFLVDGRRIKNEDTPESLNLQDDDVIDAVVEQLVRALLVTSLPS